MLAVLKQKFLLFRNNERKSLEESSMRPYRSMLPALMLSTSTFLGVAVTTAPAVAALVDASKCTGAAQYQDTYNKNNPTAVAALYTSDGIEVTPAGLVVGQAAIKEDTDNSINKQGLKNLDIGVTKCDLEGALRWSAGNWKSDSPQGSVGGFWTAIEAKEGDAWKIQNLTFNLTPPPPSANK